MVTSIDAVPRPLRSEAPGTRCPACDFLNHREATASDVEDGPIYCNRCGRAYYAAALATPRAVLESSRVEWRRDWDAVVIGALIGALAQTAMEWIWR